MTSCVHLLLYFILLGSFQGEYCRVSGLVVSTYNIWNVMFHWEIRKLRIVEMIDEVKPDVIAFQEVRADISGMRNQLRQLQELLPAYKWKHFHIANQVSELPRQGSYLKGWEIEGVGLLSRHPIIKSTAQILSYKKGPDKNKRVVIHAKINVDFVGIFNIAVTHFSYDRHQQCLNAAELKKHIVDNKLENVIVLGDFNTYQDFEGPMDVLTDEKVWSKCQNVARDVLQGSKRRVMLYDAWMQCKGADAGLTFSNMPTPGLESRPDRTFIPGNMKVLSCNRSGDSSHYEQFYYNAVLWQRLKNVFLSTKSAYHGKVGRTCPHDCGPHASCRCGVCVANGNRNTCDIPECSECSADLYKYIYIYIIVIPILIVQFVYAAIKSIIVLRERKQAIFQAVGCYCCLCYARCPKCIEKPFRKLDHSIFIKMWPFCQLPALPLMFFTAFLLMVCVINAMSKFSPFYHTVMMMLPEELNTSDHQMLTFEIRLLLP